VQNEWNASPQSTQKSIVSWLPELAHTKHDSIQQENLASRGVSDVVGFGTQDSESVEALRAGRVTTAMSPTTRSWI